MNRLSRPLASPANTARVLKFHISQLGEDSLSFAHLQTARREVKGEKNRGAFLNEASCLLKLVLKWSGFVIHELKVM